MQNMQNILPAPQDMDAENDLRAKLAAVITPQQQHPHLGPGPHGYGDPSHHLSSASPHDHNIDPAIGGHGMMGGSSAGGDGGSGDDDMGDGRKGGKRELSQSKRAAQNRAAQRAFRQRKEGYIKKLEEQVREFHTLEDSYKQIQAENYSLREYIIHLQSRLISTGNNDLPPPPPNINLEGHHTQTTQNQPQNQLPPVQHPRAQPPPPPQPSREHGGGRDVGARDGGREAPAPLAQMAPLNSSELQASAARALAKSAAATASWGHGQHKSYEKSEDASDELIRSQLAAGADGPSSTR